MVWIAIIGFLIGVAGLLFGAWQRSNAAHAEEDAANSKKEYEQAKTDVQALAARYNAHITELESKLDSLQKAALANLPPGELANVISGLFPPVVQPPKT